MSVDDKWMRRALVLAEKGRARVYPNPMVGAVLVRDGKKIAEGYHQQYGHAHAEVEAIRRAGSRAKGSTLYVNLEPCSHWGKTPPCVLAVARAGVARVVAAMQDPNPQVSGKGFAFLRRHRISVSNGVLRDAAQNLNREFAERFKRQRPYVTMKVASSLDGRTATVTGESQWITSPKARREGHRLRAQVDAIAVGASTVRRDNPSLTSHGAGRNPIRIVFAGRRSLPRGSKIFDRSAETLVLKNKRGTLQLKKVLKELALRGVRHLLVEGGWTLQQSFLEAGVVDEVIWYMAPLIIGNAKHLINAVRLKNVSVKKIGNDVLLRLTSRSDRGEA